MYLFRLAKPLKPDAVSASANGNAIQINNPIIKDKYTADPAALVYKDKVYLYTGHDVPEKNVNSYRMNDWLVYSSSDMVKWEEHPVPLKTTDFAWAQGDAWAGQVIERNGKFYWYVAITHGTIHGKSIGIAVSDSPIGPFKDALGKAIITNDMTTQTKISWDDIDPSVIIDDDGQAYLFWGNTVCNYVKLKENMIEMDGPIQTIEFTKFHRSSMDSQAQELVLFIVCLPIS